MTEITRKITVDLARRGNSRLIFARQNDFNSRKIVINLTNAGVPFLVGKNNTVLINFARPDGESTAFYGSVENDGSVSIVLGTWQLAVVGEVKCSVSIFSDSEQKLTSADFYLDVEAALYTGEEIAADESYSVLIALMSELTRINYAEEARTGAENCRKNAEISREGSEAQRQSNETIREGYEAMRVNAENERNKAEAERDEAEVQRASAEHARAIAEEERNSFIGDIDSAIEKIIAIQQQLIEVDAGGDV